MTNLEAIKSCSSFRDGINDYLYEKALTDQGLTASGTYGSSNEKKVDLALAEVYLKLSTFSDWRAGSESKSLSNAKLLSARKQLLNKWNANKANITGKPKW